MKAAHGFLVLSALSLCLPTYAQVDSTEVKKAEDRFQRFKAIRGVNDKDYPFQLIWKNLLKILTSFLYVLEHLQKKVEYQLIWLKYTMLQKR